MPRRTGNFCRMPDARWFDRRLVGSHRFAWDGNAMMLSRRNIVVAGTAFLLGMAAALFYLREPTEPLSAASLARARMLWQNAQIQSYRARYRMHGSLYEVRVRDGFVTELLVNGQVPSVAQPGAYSIPGLLDTLAAELENMTDSSKPFGDNVVARVRFHHRWGYPERYVRGGTGLSRGGMIEMLEFEIVP